MRQVDIIIVGAGSAGMPCAIEAVTTGANVLVVEQAEQAGGTLHVTLGHMSGAGTKRQAERGIEDTTAAHKADVERISRGTTNSELLERSLPLQAKTIDWLLENGFQMDPICPEIIYLHEAYRTPRTYWGVNRGLSVLDVVKPLFDAAMARPNAELRLRTEAVSLIRNSEGHVSGVELRDLVSGTTEAVAANAVILASGGYGASAERFARWSDGHPLYTAAMPTSTGTGIEMAEAIGAQIVGRERFLPTYAGIVETSGGNRIVWDHLPSLTPQVRAPWELHLDLDGRRFVQEDIDSVDARENALATLPGLSFWCVFDDNILATAPALLPGWSAEELQTAWQSHASFVKADSLEELATKTGMKLPVLAATLDAYNNAMAAGTPDPMGRQHRPRQISGPTYRAILMHGMVLKTAAGLSVNTELNVLNENAEPIRNLYALGEAMGGSTLSGKSFVSGMSITPALALGRWLGLTLGGKFAGGTTQ